MAVQRKTRNLGLNRSRDNPKVYDYIENVLGIKEKFCTRGNRGKLGRFGLVHEGKNPIPIREFYLLNAYVDPASGKVIIKSKDGLQGACIKCDKAFRRARLSRWSQKYSKMTKEEIFAEYRKNYGELKKCSRCGIKKPPEEFPISVGMETGLHNTCKICSKFYLESVGDRWAIYSPDGHYVMTLKPGDKCQICGTGKSLSKDHIWPLARGGTDNKENAQILCENDNWSKSDTIMGFTSVHEINDMMICERYREIFEKAKKENWDLTKFTLEISKAVKKFIIWKRSLTDDQLADFFGKEKARNNRKHSVGRAVRKFREYCDVAILDIDEYISKNRPIN